MPHRRIRDVLRGLPMLVALQVPQVHAEGEASELSNLTFEDLSQIQIVTASKNPVALGQTPAAVHVITGDDMARLGAQSFPQALRYAPGVDVGQISTFQWSVSMRGFNGQFTNQLLVLMDGRPILNPNNGGVSWYNHDTYLPDLDRIEVVRGAAGSLWGSNATNGVINILTKDAASTLGFSAQMAGGNLNPVTLGARKGFALGKQTFARVYFKVAKYSGIPLSATASDQGEWTRAQAGFRVDHHGTDSHLTLQGDVYQTTADSVYPFPTLIPPYSSTEWFKTHTDGVNVLTHWRKELGSDSELVARAYFDHFELDGEANRQCINQFDAEAQHTFRPWGAHGITYGFGIRRILAKTPPTRITQLPAGDESEDTLASVFLQDEVSLLEEKVSLIVGGRAEHNEYTGWEYAPNLRVSYKPTQEQLYWIAANMTMNAPTAFSTGINFDSSARPPGIINRLVGEATHAESMKSFEAGYRLQPTRNAYMEVALFLNDYDHLMFIDRANARLEGIYSLIPWRNGADGRTQGGELTVGWDPLPTWRLVGSFSMLESTVAEASVGRGDKGSTPRNKASLTMSVDLPKRVRIDLGFRHVGRLSNPEVPSYEELDLRVAWRPTEFLEFEVVGQNLLNPRHVEAPRSLSSLQSTIPRSFFGGMVFKY